SQPRTLPPPHPTGPPPAPPPLSLARGPLPGAPHSFPTPRSSDLTITFNLYGPNDATCATSIFSSASTVAGNGAYTSGSFTPVTSAEEHTSEIQAGGPIDTRIAIACNGTNESVVVSPRTPTVSTEA